MFSSIVGDHKDGMGPPSAKIQVHGGRPLICTSYYDACDNIISMECDNGDDEGEVKSIRQ